jgi:hypothetical protein
LNVVVGDDLAANSIGKSTLLMIIDFAFGGNAFLSHNADTVEELGDQEYFFKFVFGGELFRFRRGTEDPLSVHLCDDRDELKEKWSLDSYTEFLKDRYDINYKKASFRELVGRYARIWGKPNNDVTHPLYAAPKEKGTAAVDSLVKLFGRYSVIAGLSSKLEEANSEKAAFGKATGAAIIPRVTKASVKKNETSMRKMEQEIDGIKAHLTQHAFDIRSVANDEVLDLKLERDELLDQKLSKEARLARLRKNLEGGGAFRSKQIERLKELFPQINVQKLGEVEEFHRGITKVLKQEMKRAAKAYEEELAQVDKAILSIDRKLEDILQNIENPSLIVDRIYGLSSKLALMREENALYERKVEVEDRLKEARKRLSVVKGRILERMALRLNREMAQITERIYGAHRQSPTITLSGTGHNLSVPEDTGTGKAYANLIIFDMSVFRLTKLPVMVHDSMLFKNVENKAVVEMLEQYVQFRKQCFVAIDEIEKYGREAVNVIERNMAIKLSDEALLFTKDWRTAK